MSKKIDPTFPIAIGLIWGSVEKDYALNVGFGVSYLILSQIFKNNPRRTQGLFYSGSAILVATGASYLYREHAQIPHK